MKPRSHLDRWTVITLPDGRAYAEGICGDHDRLRAGPIRTSEIVARGDGWIESRNTRYSLGEPAPIRSVVVVEYPDYSSPSRKRQEFPPVQGDGLADLWDDDDPPAFPLN